MDYYLFIFEYLLTAFWVLQTFVLRTFEPDTSNIRLPLFLLWTMLIILKIRIEGSRPNIFLFLLIEPILLSTSSLITHLLLISFVLLQISSSKVYKFPKTKGQFLPGFFSHKIQDNINLAIFYPTLQEKPDTTYTENFNILDRTHQSFLKRLPIPKFIIYLAFSFVKHIKLGINHNAEIAKDHLGDKNLRSIKFPVIIFNHAIATNHLLYTSFFREWASRGYIVFSIDTDEVLLTPSTGPADPVRFIQIENRYKQFERTLEFVTDKTQYQKVLGANIELDEERIITSGHSFGAAAACLAAYRLRKVTGCVLLDPWLWPMDNEVLSRPIAKPLLVIRSETYYDRNKDMKLYEKLERLIEANKGKETTLSCYFEGTGHASPCDLSFLMPGMLKAQGLVEKDIVNVLEMSNELIDIFVEKVGKNEKGMEKDGEMIKEDVIQRFRQFVHKKKLPKLLKVDAFGKCEGRQGTSP